MLSLEEERNLIRRCRKLDGKGDCRAGCGAACERGCKAARETLILAHAPMLKAMSRRFSETVADREDLMNEGVAALMTALDRFDLSRNIRFSTYAVWWVFTFMQEHRTSRHIVRMGRSRGDKAIMSRIAFARREFGDLSAAAAEGLVAKSLGVSPCSVANIGALLSGGAVDVSVLDYVPSGHDADTAVAGIVENNQHDFVGRALAACCDARETAIIMARWFSEKPEVYSDIGARLGISGERARQIELRAMVSIRKWLEGHGVSGSDLF